MSTTTITAPTTDAASFEAQPRSLRRDTVVVGLGAAVVTMAAAAVLHAAGVSLAVDGETIPPVACAQMTFLGAVIGGVMVAVLNRRSAASRRRFLESAAALTALSCVPSVALPDDVGSKVSLVALHLLAAAIIVPMLARHAND